MRKILLLLIVVSLILLSGCSSYKPDEVKNVDCKIVSKEDAMMMCLDMVSQCSVPAVETNCYKIYNYVSGGETLCNYAKKIEKELCQR